MQDLAGRVRLSVLEALAWCLRRPWAMLFVLLCGIIVVLQISTHRHKTAKPKPTVAVVAEKPVEKKAAPELKIEQLCMLGKGVWIYTLDRIGSVELIVSRAKAAGLSHLVVKTDDYGDAWHACPRQKLAQLADACVSNGIAVYGYGRCSGTDPHRDAALACDVLAIPKMAGYIFDMEKEYKLPGKDKAAETTLSEVKQWLKARQSKQLLGYSSFAITSFHAKMPWDVLNKYCDFVMPQDYFGSWWHSHRLPIGRAIKLVAGSWHDCPKSVIPVMQSYDVSRKDLQWFLERLDTSAGLSFFRWELMDESDWELLRAFKCGPAKINAIPTPTMPKTAKASGARTGAETTVKTAPVDIPNIPEPKQPIKATGSGGLNRALLIIDPGHGGAVKHASFGIDTGCNWPFGETNCFEPAYTFRMAYELAIEAGALGADVAFTGWSKTMYVQTQPNEVLPVPQNVLTPWGMPLVGGNAGLRMRRDIANRLYRQYRAQYKKVIFVSIHVDSMGSDGKHKIVWKGQHVSYQEHDQNHLLADLVGQAIVANHYGRAVNGEAKDAEDVRNLQVLRGNIIPNRILFESGIPGDESSDKPGSANDNYRLRNGPSRKAMVHRVLVEPLVSLMR